MQTQLKDENTLLIDDLRNTNAAYVARNPDAAFHYLSLKEWDEVQFDNDLGEASHEGYQILDWMLGKGIFPKTVILVTSNPVARDRMAASLLASGYKKRTPMIFKRI